MTYDRAGAARHEAGHCAAAVVCGHLPEWASADWPEADKAGKTILGWGEVTRASILDRMLVLLMGPLVEAMPGWPPEWPIDPTAPPPPAQSDARALRGLAHLANLDEREWLSLCKEANNIAQGRTFKRLVSLIEAALMLKDELDRDDLAWLLGPDRLRRYGIDREEQTCST